MSRFLAALLIALTASACTPAMQGAWRAMSPAERDAYALRQRWQRRLLPGARPALAGVVTAVGSQHRRPRIRQTRAGGGEPRSTARGCWQLLLSLHSGRFSKLGYSPSQWADPDVNTLVALDLYREAGTSPWSL